MSNSYQKWLYEWLSRVPAERMTYGASNGQGNNNNKDGKNNAASRRRRPAPKPKPKPSDKPKPENYDDLLKVKDVNLRASENKKQHHTKVYRHQKDVLIVRRGQRFEITVKFDRKFNEEKDEIVFELETGDEPRPSKRTMFSLRPKKDMLTPKDWAVRVMGKPDGNDELRFRIMPAVDAAIGRWKLSIKTVWDRKSTESEIYEQPGHIYILFNPWCNADQTFMSVDDDCRSDDGSDWGSDAAATSDESSGSDNDEEDEDAGPDKRKPDLKKLREYILNETGYVYRGSHKKISPKAWNYGQFEKECFETAMLVLDMSGIREEARSNATLVARTLTRMVNSNQDDGILTGKWGGGYTGGTKPTAWNGSVAICEEYLTNKSEVKYGQCWVFSALLTTLGRSLGLPTRSVTNFASAHDTDASMTIDKHVDMEFDKLSEYDDSIWNFHVWNEAWFKRPDLPAGYDGWQAFDATPQELSEGDMQCGPAPLKAIRNGEVYIGYDTKFIYGEVNGDSMTWMVDDENNISPIKLDAKNVGKHISTKVVGKPKLSRYHRYNRREIREKNRKDITLLYKHPEGSAEERESNENAMSHSSRRGALDEFAPPSGDVTFLFKADESYDGDMTARLIATNTSGEERTAMVKVSVHAIYYTGQPGEMIKEDTTEMVLPPNGEKEHVINIKTSEYINKIDADAEVDFFCRAKVKETEQRFVSEDEMVRVEKPDLEITTSNEKPKVGEKFTVSIKFTNPLNVDLTDVNINLESAGMQKNMKVPLSDRMVAAGGKLETSVDITPSLKGKHEIMASLTSKQLTDIDGQCLVLVKKA